MLVENTITFLIELQATATVLEETCTKKLKVEINSQQQKSSSKTLEIADQNDYRALKMERGRENVQ